MKNKISIYLIRIMYITIFYVLVGNVFAEAEHTIKVVNNSSFPVNLKNISGNCIKTQFGGGFLLPPGKFGLVEFDDSNTGNCYYADKNVSFDLVSNAFSSNPIYSEATQNIQFVHSSYHTDWSTTIWTAPRNNTTISAQCADLYDQGIWSNPHKNNCINGEKFATEQTMVYLTISNPPSFQFQSNMQIFNLSSIPVQLSESFSNCQLNGTLPSTILSGMQTPQYSMNITPTNDSKLGQCGITASYTDIIQRSFNFGVNTVYPETSLSWVGNPPTDTSINTSNFVQCMNDVSGTVQTSIVDNPSKCFIGCPVSQINKGGLLNASSSDKIQYKYYRSYRGVPSNEPLKPIKPAIDYNSMTSSNIQDIRLICVDAGSINTNVVSPRITKDPILGIASASYLLSKNKKYYLFCQTGKAADNKVELTIMMTGKNLPIKRKVYEINGQSSGGILMLQQSSGNLYYLNNDRKASGLILGLLRLEKQPMTMELSDEGEFIYSNSVGKIYEKF